MADRRKLQGEIERCQKKITEGVDIFEDIWQKIQAAPNVAMKEKHEADLKKEIKKLQRLRDQLKTWLAASDIKDKKTLLEHKRLIEVQMELFKVIERETKTKAYSKEGLGAATKVDPKEKEKEDMINWLSNAIEELNVQIDQFESEIEAAGSKKKKLDKEQDVVESNKQHVEKHRYHIDQLETIMRLVNNDALDIQQIMKIKDDVEYYISSSKEADFEPNDYLYDDLNLEEVSASLGAKISALHDDNESGISETSETLSQQNSSSPSPSPSLTTTSSHHSKGEEEGPRTRLRSSASESQKHATQQNGPSSSTSAHSAGGGRSGGGGTTGGKHGGVKSSSTTDHQQQQRSNSTSSSSSSTTAGAVAHTGSSQDSSAPAGPTTPHSQNYAQAAGAFHHLQQQQLFNPGTGSGTTVDKKVAVAKAHGGDVAPFDSSSSGTWGSKMPLVPPSSSAWGDSSATSPVSVKTSTTHPLLSLAAAARGQLQQQQLSANGQTVSDQGTGSGDDIGVAKLNGPMTAVPNSTATQMNIPAGAGSTVQSPTATTATATTDPSSATVALSSLKSMTQNIDPSTLSQSASGADISHNSTPFPRNPIQMGTNPPSLPEYQNLLGAGSKPGNVGSSGGLVSTRFHPVFGVSPLGPQPLNRVNLVQLAMLDSAATHLPLPDDSERVRMYFPRTPTVVPHYYAHLPPQICDSLDFFNRLSIETLFFIFYYMEGTKAQYLAAKALKNKSWRFHTKLLMWFQRHEEPKIITEEYELGSYQYFDFEMWVQRQHDSFTFEYKYLEDHELQ